MPAENSTEKSPDVTMEDCFEVQEFLYSVKYSLKSKFFRYKLACAQTCI